MAASSDVVTARFTAIGAPTIPRYSSQNDEKIIELDLKLALAQVSLFEHMQPELHC